MTEDEQAIRDVVMGVQYHRTEPTIYGKMGAAQAYIRILEDRLRASPVSADVALRERVTQVEAELFTAGEYEWAAKLRAALSRVPSSVAASGGEQHG